MHVNLGTAHFNFIGDTMESRSDILRDYVDEVTIALWNWVQVYTKQLAEQNPDLYADTIAFLNKDSAETSNPNAELIVKTFKLLQVRESMKWGPNGKA